MEKLLAVLGLLPAIINTVKAVEAAVPMSGAGKAKLDAVIGILGIASDLS